MEIYFYYLAGINTLFFALIMLSVYGLIRASFDDIKLNNKLNEFDARNFILRTIQVELKKRGVDKWPSQKQN